MPWHLVRKNDGSGSYELLTDGEYNDRRSGGGGGGFGLIGLVAAVLIFYVFASGSNFLNVAVMKDFGVPLYLRNVIFLYEGDRCQLLFSRPEYVDNRRARPPLPIYAAPVEFDRPLRAPVDSFNRWASFDESQAVAMIDFPLMIKFRGRRVPRKYDYLTDTRRGTNKVWWHAVTVQSDGREIHGYIPTYRGPSATRSYEIGKNIGFFRDNEFINHYKLDRAKLSGNRFGLRFDESCNFKMVEL